MDGTDGGFALSWNICDVCLVVFYILYTAGTKHHHHHLVERVTAVPALLKPDAAAPYEDDTVGHVPP